MRRTWTRRLAAPLVLVAVVAGCSDDTSAKDDDGATKRSTTTTDATTSSTVALDSLATSSSVAGSTSTTTRRANRSTPTTAQSTTKVVDRRGGTSEVIEGPEITVDSNETVSTPPTTSTTSTTVARISRSVQRVEQITEPTTELSVEVDAPPADVWRVVSDITRIPEWSPVCHRCEWIDGASAPIVGARFRGHNKLNGARWSRDCKVTASEPEAVFAFSTSFKGQESTRWRYRLEPTPSGTRVSEAYQVVMVPRWVRAMRLLPGASAKTERDTQQNIETSLDRLKAIIEAQP